MKKKLLCAGLSAALAMSWGATAFAGTITSNGGAESHPVYAVYGLDAEAPTVYSVGISWGSMEFTYQAAPTTKTWDPATHTYKEEVGEAIGWTNEDGANKITVTSRSNKALTAMITTEMVNDGTNDYSGIKAEPADANLPLADASVNATTEIPGTEAKAETTISLSGELTNKDANKTKIGSITVTIADAEEVTP
ncbi:MAG: hypothetical protein Q4C58_01000 [Eubacteriales bacterium]|nr:hypothetical protein [Eubacteriales bacterium]